VQQLDAVLKHFAQIIERDLGVQVDAVAGAGAAGGMGAAMLAFLKGQLRPGCEIIARAVDLDAAVRDADLAITGEGRIDQQTIFGKTPFGVARSPGCMASPSLASLVVWAPMPMWCMTMALTPSSACSAASVASTMR
jgi:glycerate kinase